LSHVFFYNFFGRRGAGTTLAQPGWDNPYAAGQAFLGVQIRRPKGSPKPPRCAQRAPDTAAQGRDEAHRPTHWAAPCHPPEWPPEFLKILGNGFLQLEIPILNFEKIFFENKNSRNFRGVAKNRPQLTIHESPRDEDRCSELAGVRSTTYPRRKCHFILPGRLSPAGKVSGGPRGLRPLFTAPLQLFPAGESRPGRMKWPTAFASVLDSFSGRHTHKQPPEARPTKRMGRTRLRPESTSLERAPHCLLLGAVVYFWWPP